jgi:hypothetical protein
MITLVFLEQTKFALDALHLLVFGFSFEPTSKITGVLFDSFKEVPLAFTTDRKFDDVTIFVGDAEAFPLKK